MGTFGLLCIAIVSEVVGTMALRMSDGFTRWIPSLVAVGGYIAAFYFLALSLRSIPVGIAYATWSGVGIVLISILSYAFFNQKLDFPALLGIAMIIVGVIIVNVFSQAHV